MNLREQETFMVMKMAQQEGLLIGASVTKVPEDLLFSYGTQVSRALAQHTDTMLQYSPEEIVGIIHEGRAIVVVKPHDHLECVAFAQISPWINEFGVVEAVEFRSWKSWSNGKGLVALYGGILLSHQLYPSIPIYAVVEASNSKAQQKLSNAGALHYDGMPSGMRIELHEGEASVSVFALSGVHLKGEI